MTIKAKIACTIIAMISIALVTMNGFSIILSRAAHDEQKWLVALGLIALASLAGIAISKRIARPISNLAQQTTKIAKGKFDEYIEVPS